MILSTPKCPYKESTTVTSSKHNNDFIYLLKNKFKTSLEPSACDDQANLR